MKGAQNLLPIVLGGLLCSTPLLAQVELSSWDENGDERISLEEWDAGIEANNIFDLLDENENGIFDVDEADEGIFEYDISYDLDDGGHIERQEFTLGVFEKHDRDGDEQLNSSEFQAFSENYESSDFASID